MSRRVRGWVGVGAMALGVAGVIAPVTGGQPQAAQGAARGRWSPPKTAWGHPDLQGVWNNATPVPLERPNGLEKAELDDEEAASLERTAMARRDAPPPAGDPGTYNAFWSDTGRGGATKRTALIIDPPDGRIPPLTPQAQKREADRAAIRYQRGPADSYVDRNRWERCLARGLPMAPGPYNNSYRFLQTPAYAVIYMEMIHDTRIIPLDGRPHGTVRTWLGDSRGHWEGDTLVVETVNFVNRLDGTGEILPSHRGAMFQHRGSGETLTITERFTRVAADTLNYEFTLADPQTYTRPWTALVPMALNTDPFDQPYEYACHEGNQGLPNIMKGARAEDAAGRPGLGEGSWTAGRRDAGR
ncbi:MAG: hypothetical protein AB7O32_07680 [Vicinamibacterales bacterium]